MATISLVLGMHKKAIKCAWPVLSGTQCAHFWGKTCMASTGGLWDNGANGFGKEGHGAPPMPPTPSKACTALYRSSKMGVECNVFILRKLQENPYVKRGGGFCIND